MTVTLTPGRGRPRTFNPDDALAIGQRLFHHQGYEGVGMAALLKRLGIKPPSFYSAFGNKADFFERVLARYAGSVLTLGDILRPGRRPAEALADLLERAASTYAADPEARGCLVLESIRGNDDEESVRRARKIGDGRRRQLRDFIAASHPATADAVTDFMTSTMSGLSASAREGMGETRLLIVARAAGRALPELLSYSGPTF